ncbi:MAG: Tol-Pal system beta propeller repeat protein TolB [Deltaproteobacteria bacterium]|nr:Tol-Pal system beta propeller repeat protein TolB [Deltaproteobacteria bacterium]
MNFITYNYRKLLHLFFILALVCSANPARAQRLHIIVGGPNFRPFPIAAPKIASVGKSSSTREAAELTEIIQQDVDLARSLELVPPSSYLVATNDTWQNPRYQNWVNVGASALIRGIVEKVGKNIKVSLKLYDVISQREILNKVYQDKPTKTAYISHQFIDAVIMLLTGEEGIYSSKIAYIKNTRKAKALYNCDADGRNPKRITDSDVLNLLPAWDPTGRFILFTSYLKGNPDLYRFDRSNNSMQVISSQRGLNTGAKVSPDGKHIALTLSIDGNTEIYVMDTNGKNLRRLTDSWGQDVSPTWSPDGRRIAFVSSRSGNPHLYIMNADGSEVRRLTFQGNYNQEPNWSPRAGGQIVFTARDERLKFDIFIVHPETGEITRLTQDDGDNESPSFSPDGHQIVFISTRAPGSSRKLMIMDADGKNQRRVSFDLAEYEMPAWGPRLGYQ